MNALTRLVALIALPLSLFAASGCAAEGCLDGAEGCVVPSPCQELAFTCDAGESEIRVLVEGETASDNPAVLASPGDFLLRNDQVEVVIDGLDHPHYLAPTGGSVIDFSLAGQDNDGLRHIEQAVGVLPEQAISYTSAEILEDGDIKALQLKGHLTGHEDILVATRYEIRPCEPGIRVRTEVANLSADAESMVLSDAWYWGDRDHIPFSPRPGSGFDHPSFGLGTLATAIFEAPFLAAGGRPTGASYASIGCSANFLSGFQSVEVSTAGNSARVVLPRDAEVFERFLAAGPGTAVAGAADVALEVRQQLWGETWTELSGSVTVSDGTELGRPVRAQVVISEGSLSTPIEERIPWTHAIPDSSGQFTVRVPTQRNYVIAAEAFGLPAGEVEVQVGTAGVTADPLELPAVGRLTLDATVDGAQEHVQVFLVPADDDTLESVSGKMLGSFYECAPLLGSSIGSSPACDRVLVDGPVDVMVPPGTYDLFATAGPFTTLAREPGVVVSGGSTDSLSFALERLPLLPAGALSADFHVHGSASFDTGFPDYDRVRAWLASDLDVITSTEHDTMWDYAAAVEALGATDRLELILGTETTGHILFSVFPDAAFPKVIGHWNAWPLPFDPEGPYRGGVWDELVLPGGLFDRFEEAGLDPANGVIQLNHPVGGSQFGRDFGWVSALEMDLTRPVVDDGGGLGQSQFLATPSGASHSNADYHVQEVMNGTNNGSFQQYRAFWFYLLNQAIFRAGTANSDSHTLADNVIGTPRTVVWSDTDLASFDVDVFNEAVRGGRMIGTNGPIIQATVVQEDGTTYTPGFDVIVPDADALLQLEITAAPWVPVDEVRFVANGKTMLTFDVELDQPDDPFGSAGTTRLSWQGPLSALLTASGDSWLVIEAGHALEPNEDLDCDGIPDTGDNNGDGNIDWEDVEDIEQRPEGSCLDSSGPLTEPEAPTDRESPDWFFRAVTPGGYPVAFTNPFIFDRDGGGFQAVNQ